MKRATLNWVCLMMSGVTLQALLGHAEPARASRPTPGPNKEVENNPIAQIINPAPDISAIERFRQLGVVPDDAFFVDDLARVPACLSGSSRAG